MAFTVNNEKVGHALALVKAGLRPFLERHLKGQYRDQWRSEIQRIIDGTRLGGGRGDPLEDIAVQLIVIDRCWALVFQGVLRRAERSLVNEIIDLRNRWAHQEAFSDDDADRALDTMGRLLKAISAPQVQEVYKLREEIRRLIYPRPASAIETAETEVVKSNPSAGKSPRRRKSAKTTEPGYVNKNGQKVIRRTALPGTDHGQFTYVLKCGNCQAEYGANGSDIWLRRCPHCDGGAKGLPIK